MSICEQSFHFAPPSQSQQSKFGDGPVMGGGNILAGMGGGPKSTASGSMIFAQMDDAKTLSMADEVHRNNQMELMHEVKGGNIGESNETKMSDNEAFLAYCKQDDDDD